jgi:hypothetical protein
LEDLRYLIPALIRLEQDWAAKCRVVAEQICGLIEIPLFDGGAEAVREHRRQQPNVRQESKLSSKLIIGVVWSE